MNEIAKVLSAVLSHVYQWAAYVAVHKKTLIVSVLVPVLQPLIAAIAVIFTVRIEAKKSVNNESAMPRRSAHNMRMSGVKERIQPRLWFSSLQQLQAICSNT